MTVRFAPERLLSTLENAETGQRGYLLTGEPAYLKLYNAALARLPDDLARLGSASFGDPARQYRATRITSLVKAEIAELNGGLALREAGHGHPAAAEVPRDAGEHAIDAILAEVDAIQADRISQLAKAQANSRSFLRWAAVVGLAGLALGPLGWVVLARRSTREKALLTLSHLGQFTRAFGLTQGMIRDLDGRIVFWSDGAQRLYGYSRQQAMGRISHDLLRTVLPEPLSDIEAILMRDGHWHGELTHYRRDGKVLHVVCHWALHRGRAGEADSVIVVGSDITELKQAEAELRESELRLRMTLNASRQGIWLWEFGDDGFELQWDACCKALYGFTSSARVDYATWAGAIHPDDRAMAEAAMARALDPADPNDDYACSFRVVHPDGNVAWLAARGSAMFAGAPHSRAGRRTVRILGTIHDVSDAFQVEQERQRSANLLRTIMEAAPGLIYVKDRRGRMVAANQAVIKLLGRPWAEVEGRTDFEILADPARAEAVMYNDRQIMEQRRTERVEELFNDEDGDPQVWLSTKAPMLGPDGRVTGIVGVSVDITDRKRDETQLRLMVNELNHRVKNTLATVQAIASQTLRGIDMAIRHTLEDRLQAVAAAHDVLTRETWQGAALDDVVSGSLVPFGGREAPRFQVSGPPLRLCPRAALVLAIGLHELATNALKYGALSDMAGKVDIHWEITLSGMPSLRLTWTERDGPRVAPPTRRGFGTLLLERSLAQDLGGTARLRFDRPEGVICLIEAPLTEVVATAEIIAFPRVGYG